MTELDLFAAAIGTSDPAARAALLERECAADPALRERLEKLLAAHFAARSQPDPDFAATRTGADVAATADPDGTPTRQAVDVEAPGGVVAGRYKLLQKIGEGGMGSVWMAEQTEPIKRKVAVKLIRADKASSATILARFEAERQAIALMDHPHIAKLLDAGTWSPSPEQAEAKGGQPFFVMELVKGVPLTEFCDTHRLTIPERLALFQQICLAVQHAHQKGIIHRDLKPGNILVESHDGNPIPKVIDFGLAKATSGMPLTENTLFTGFGSVMGTPLYMAPEQATFNAVDVDTRSDVYALGVILYELLTGSTPLTRDSMKRAALDEVLRLIREQDAPTPSSRLSSADAAPSIAANRQTEPAKLGRLMRGELDWIALKALSKNRDRRYTSPTDLAADVARFLNHEPVTAGPPSRWYKFRKFVRRNRPQVVAAGVVFLALVAGVIGTALGLVEARKQEGIARDEADAKEQARAAATANETKAVDASNRLREARDELWANLYAARSNLIQTAWERNNVGRLRELLTAQVPAAGERDLRGWEWHFWRRRANAELRTHAPATRGLLLSKNVLSRDGRRVVGLDINPDRVHIHDVASGAEVAQFDPQWFDGEVGGVADRFEFSPDGSKLVASVFQLGDDRHPADLRLGVWDVATGKRLFFKKGLPQPPSLDVPAISPNGRRLVALVGADGQPNGVFRQWELATGKELATIKDLPGPSFRPVYSLDDSLLAAVGPEGAIVWDAATGKEKVRTKKPITCLAFSPDGTRLAGAGSDLILWEATTGKEVYTAASPNTGVVVFSPDGTRLACLTSGPVVFLRDAATGRMVRTLKGHTGGVVSAAFSPDGRTLTTAGDDDVVKVWDALATDTPTQLEGISPAAGRPALSGDGSTLAVSWFDQQNQSDVHLQVYDVTGRLRWSRKETLPWKVGLGENSVVLSPNGQRVAWGVAAPPVGEVGKPQHTFLRVWDVAGGRQVLDVKGEPGMEAVAFSPDGTRLAYVAPEPPRAGEKNVTRLVKVVDAVTGREVMRVPGPSNVNSAYVFRFSPDGRLLMASFSSDQNHDALVEVWDAATGRVVTELKFDRGRGEPFQLLPAFTSDAARLAVAKGGTVVVYDLPSSRPVITLSRQGGPVTALAFTPDGARLVSSAVPQDGDAPVTFWEVATGQELLTLPGPAWTQVLHFSADGHRLFAVGAGSGEQSGLQVRLWDATPIPEPKK